MLYVGFCPKCGEGLLGIRCCAGPVPHAVVLCDECDALWTAPDQVCEPATYPEQPDLPCPICQASLNDDPAHWATDATVRDLGWMSHVKGMYASPDQTTDGGEFSNLV